MPFTVNRSLNIPNTGDLPGAWGTTAVNANMNALDGQLGGVVTVSLTNVNVTLTSNTSGTITPSAGPTQSDNAVVKFSGTLTGNCTITFPYPGYYIVENGCTVGTFYVQARASGTGNVIGLPPGEPCHVYSDGTNMKYVNMGRVGEYMDMAVSTTPPWMTACTVQPYLPCMGQTVSIATFAALAALLGTTFGGNGLTHIGLPDMSNRFRIPIDLSGSSRVTLAGSGITGTLFGAAGGSEFMQSHLHTSTFSAKISYSLGNTYTDGGSGPPVTVIQAGPNANVPVTIATTMPTATNGTGSSQNMPPSLVAGITFIKT